MLNQHFRRIALSLASLLLAGLSHFSVAQQVTLLSKPQPVEANGKIEVLEFFAYACGHCYQVEPHFEAWAKRQPHDVQIRRIPSSVLASVFNTIPVYYTLEAMGKLDKLHPLLFDALHREHVIIGSPVVFAKWLTQNGIDPKQFDATQKSFSVANKIGRAQQLANDYQISGTPTFIVNGRHAVIQSATGTSQELFASIDALIASARQSQHPTAAAKK